MKSLERAVEPQRKHPPRTQPRETGSATVSTLMQKKLCVITQSYVWPFERHQKFWNSRVVIVKRSDV